MEENKQSLYKEKAAQYLVHLKSVLFKKDSKEYNIQNLQSPLPETIKFDDTFTLNVKNFRDYQLIALMNIFETIAGDRNTILDLCPSSGKTFLYSQILSQLPKEIQEQIVLILPDEPSLNAMKEQLKKKMPNCAIIQAKERIIENPEQNEENSDSNSDSESQNTENNYSPQKKDLNEYLSCTLNMDFLIYQCQKILKDKHPTIEELKKELTNNPADFLAEVRKNAESTKSKLNRDTLMQFLDILIQDVKKKPENDLVLALESGLSDSLDYCNTKDDALINDLKAHFPDEKKIDSSLSRWKTTVITGFLSQYKDKVLEMLEDKGIKDKLLEALKDCNKKQQPQNVFLEILRLCTFVYIEQNQSLRELLDDSATDDKTKNKIFCSQGFREIEKKQQQVQAQIRSTEATVKRLQRYSTLTTRLNEIGETLYEMEGQPIEAKDITANFVDKKNKEDERILGAFLVYNFFKKIIEKNGQNLNDLCSNENDLNALTDLIQFNPKHNILEAKTARIIFRVHKWLQNQSLDINNILDERPTINNLGDIINMILLNKLTYSTNLMPIYVLYNANNLKSFKEELQNKIVFFDEVHKAKLEDKDNLNVIKDNPQVLATGNFKAFQGANDGLQPQDQLFNLNQENNNKLTVTPEQLLQYEGARRAKFPAKVKAFDAKYDAMEELLIKHFSNINVRLPGIDEALSGQIIDETRNGGALCFIKTKKDAEQMQRMYFEVQDDPSFWKKVNKRIDTRIAKAKKILSGEEKIPDAHFNFRDRSGAVFIKEKQTSTGKAYYYDKNDKTVQEAKKAIDAVKAESYHIKDADDLCNKRKRIIAINAIYSILYTAIGEEDVQEYIRENKITKETFINKVCNYSENDSDDKKIKDFIQRIKEQGKTPGEFVKTINATFGGLIDKNQVNTVISEFTAEKKEGNPERSLIDAVTAIVENGAGDFCQIAPYAEEANDPESFKTQGELIKRFNLGIIDYLPADASFKQSIDLPDLKTVHKFISTSDLKEKEEDTQKAIADIWQESLRAFRKLDAGIVKNVTVFHIKGVECNIAKYSKDALPYLFGFLMKSDTLPILPSEIFKADKKLSEDYTKKIDIHKASKDNDNYFFKVFKGNLEPEMIKFVLEKLKKPSFVKALNNGNGLLESKALKKIAKVNDDITLRKLKESLPSKTQDLYDKYQFRNFEEIFLNYYNKYNYYKDEALRTREEDIKKGQRNLKITAIDASKEALKKAKEAIKSDPEVILARENKDLLAMFEKYNAIQDAFKKWDGRGKPPYPSNKMTFTKKEQLQLFFYRSIFTLNEPTDKNLKNFNLEELAQEYNNLDAKVTKDNDAKAKKNIKISVCPHVVAKTKRKKIFNNGDLYNEMTQREAKRINDLNNVKSKVFNGLERLRPVIKVAEPTIFRKSTVESSKNGMENNRFYRNLNDLKSKAPVNRK